MTSNNIFRLLFLVTCLLPLALCAQTKAEMEAKVNEIKLDDNYIFGEGFDDDKGIAYENALSDLAMTANQLREGKGKEPLGQSQLQVKAKEIAYSDEARTTVFLYIPYDDVLAMEVKSPAKVLPGKPSIPSKPSKPSVSSTSSTSSTPSTPATANSSSSAQSSLGELTELICQQDNWTEIKPILQQYKSGKKISQTGVAQSLSDVPAEAYAVRIDGMYGILTVLSPAKGGTRTDMKAETPFTDSNNDNCKVIVWYK